MKTTHSILTATGIIGAVLAAGTNFTSAQQDATTRTGSDPAAFASHSSSSQTYERLVCAIHPIGDSKVKGTVLFDRDTGGVKVTAEIGGLDRDKQYAIRIHEFGDLGSERAASVGDHFQPLATAHSSGSTTRSQADNRDTETTTPTNPTVPSGRFGSGTLGSASPGVSGTSPATEASADTTTTSDYLGLGSATADSDGVIKIQKTLSHIELNGSASGILGRAIVLHEVGSNDRLENGTRVGAGVIGISKDGLKDRESGYNPKDTNGDSALNPDRSGTSSGTNPTPGTNSNTGTVPSKNSGTGTATESKSNAGTGTNSGSGTNTETDSKDIDNDRK